MADHNYRSVMLYILVVRHAMHGRIADDLLLVLQQHTTDGQGQQAKMCTWEDIGWARSDNIRTSTSSRADSYIEIVTMR